MKYEIQIVSQNETVATTNRDWEIAIVRANALHGQIAGLTGQIQALEQKRWMTAAVLGGLLTRMKAAAQHGEWGKLFSNGNHDSHFKFSKRTGDKYVSLYREVLKRAKKLGTVDVALIESGRRDARTLEEIGKLSDADSLRQAYFDFGVVSAPKSHGFKESGNPAGRPAGEKETDPEAELAEARKLATYAKNKLCQDLSEFCDLGRHALLDKDDLAALEIVLRSTLDQVQAARKSAQDRPSNPDSLPVADVFASNGDDLPSIPFPAV
ncbi:hypothetical protein [Akkermansia massiliensis]|uniref:hypothetical protein n=1 Tax=Akkermansia massiliensis TaxID=2927224 RepID=UPI002030CB59|nr:hypothetical protein [Akkermansia sp. B2-R-115]MCM0685395.1 hypothetical protein [Akkermansia sp. B2-R-115]